MMTYTKHPEPRRTVDGNWQEHVAALPDRLDAIRSDYAEQIEAIEGQRQAAEEAAAKAQDRRHRLHATVSKEERAAGEAERLLGALLSNVAQSGMTNELRGRILDAKRKRDDAEFLARALGAKLQAGAGRMMGDSERITVSEINRGIRALQTERDSALRAEVRDTVLEAKRRVSDSGITQKLVGRKRLPGAVADALNALDVDTDLLHAGAAQA